MERKLIFLDVDGTIVADLSKPTQAVRDALRQARAQGHLVFLSTGRNLPIIGRDILEIGFDGIIASAGSYVVAGKDVLYDSLLPESLVQECLAVFHERGMFCRIETPEGIYTDPQMENLLMSASADPANSELIRMQKEIEAGLDIRKYADYPKNGAYKICFTSVDLESVREAEKILGDRFDFVVHAYGHSGGVFNGEIMRKGVDKGKGIEMICDYYNEDIADTIAFGDSMNDAAMIRTAGLGVAMGNASDELKAIADVVCEDVAHDGVAAQLRRMGLCG